MLSHNATIRNAWVTSILNYIDAGSTAGRLIIRDSSNVSLITLPLGLVAGTKPSGSISLAVLTFAAITKGTCTTAGTANNFIVTDSNSNIIFSGTITSTSVGTGDMLINNTTLDLNDVIEITNITYTAPS